jgi:transposase
MACRRMLESREGFLQEAAGQVWLERLPAYAPDLNPEEGIWRHLKFPELANLCCRTVTELKVEFRRATERLRHKTNVILGCFGLAGLV